MRDARKEYFIAIIGPDLKVKRMERGFHTAKAASRAATIVNQTLADRGVFAVLCCRKFKKYWDALPVPVAARKPAATQRKRMVKLAQAG